VLRAPSQAGDVYFKAYLDAPLFTDEGPLMVELARLFPGQVPVPLAVDGDRRWVLMDDFGPVVGWEAPAEVHEEVLRAFARLQVGSLGMVDRLLAAGCFDRGLDWLAGEASEWLSTVDLTRWVTAAEAVALEAAGPRLAELCAELARSPVPPSLGHGDLHLGNVARSGGTAGGYLFFDWTDGCVLHPFIDIISPFGRDPALRDRLRDAYLSEWTPLAPRDALLRAWRLARPLAAVNQAISYTSIVRDIGRDWDADGLDAETGEWLRRVLAELAAFD
jgi:hypothetical protein